MIEGVGVHGADQGEVVGAGRQVRQEVGQLHAALSVLRELAWAAHEPRRLLLQEGEADVLGHRLGQLLAVQLVELRLGIEQVDLAGRAFEIDADTRFGLRREVRCLRGERIGCLGGEQAIVAQKRGQGGQADAARRARQEAAAGTQEEVVGGVHESNSPRGLGAEDSPLL